MKINSILYVLSMSLALPVGHIYSAHALRTASAFNRAVNRFEILSQDYADEERDKSLNLPVVIRKEIDVFVNGLGRKPKDKDIEALRSQLINKYGQQLKNDKEIPGLLAEAITRQLDVKREEDAPTLRQFLQEQYETEENLAQKFAQDLINLYVQKNMRLASRIEQAPTDVQENIEHFGSNKNALLAALFEYKKIDTSNFNNNIDAISSDGSFIRAHKSLYQRDGDMWKLQDTMQESIVGVSRDFSAIITSTASYTGFSPELHVYVLNQETQKWSLAQTISQQKTRSPILSADGSTIVIVNGDTVHSYVRQGSTWVVLKPMVIPEVKDTISITDVTISPHGLTMVIKVREQSRGRRQRGEPALFSKRAVYQRIGNTWEEINLPAGEIYFNTDDSLALISAAPQAFVYVRDGKQQWQQKQSFQVSVKASKPAQLLGNGELIIINDKDLYVQKEGFRWQKQQEFFPYKEIVPGHSDRWVKSSDDCAVLIQVYNVEFGAFGSRPLKETIISTRRGDRWYPSQTIPATTAADLSANGLVLARWQEIYAIPAAVLEAAKNLGALEWELINDLYYAQGEAQAEKSWVILNEKQREIFNKLPEMFRKQMLKKWRVATGTEKGVQYYQERQALKPVLSPEEMAAYTELKNKELKELVQQQKTRKRELEA
jgi:hypothetical protein